MGREVESAPVEQKGSADPHQGVEPKSPERNNQVKDVECTSEVPQVETSNDNQGVDDKEPCESPVEEDASVSPFASNSRSSGSAKKEPSTPHVARKYTDDEDSWSMSSSGASGRTMRSRTTVGVAPTFTVDERLEKRKEYYIKLEEKRKALEAEKREYEARTKEEEEAAIKQLRKNMVFRANPVPSFYYEKPPPKKELKKFPTTRAVSPKLGRRKSCGDMASSSPEEIGCGKGRASRHSLGSTHKEMSTTTKLKEHHKPVVASRNSSSNKLKDRSKQVKETTKNTHPKLQQTNADIAVQS